MHSLAHHLLIAMPTLGDTRFHHAVIYMCLHDADHSMGLVINHPLADLRLDEFLPAIGVNADAGHADYMVMSGGPVDPERGFVLHSDDLYIPDSTVHTGPGLCLTATREALSALSAENKPRKAAFFLGYAGWSAGQLEAEITANAWLVADAREDLIFPTHHGQAWERALASLGVHPDKLCGLTGRA
jgi:putative transcriptional regulator